MTIDKRFALITKSNEVLFPYLKRQIATKRFGFALTRVGDMDRNGGGDYTADIEEVVRRVVLDGWSVRAKAEDDHPNGTYGLGKRSVANYWLAPELHHLVSGATKAPLPHLPVRTATTASSPPGAKLAAAVESLRRIAQLTADDYERALLVVEDAMSGEQRRMLQGHAAAPDHTLSMEQIALLGGYASYGAANLQYGKLGKMFADHFSVTGLANQVQAIAQEHGSRNEHGHAQWSLRPSLVEAMDRLGLIEPQPEANAHTEGAEAEIDAEPGNSNLTTTERRALVNARLGQGGYRKQLLRLWEGRCAVTGCAIECALIASHAKAWADSNNDERLDKFNGLLLAASVDRLFDKGLIAFSDNGKLLTKPDLDATALVSVGVKLGATLRTMDKRHRPYLRAHRTAHGFETDKSE